MNRSRLGRALDREEWVYGACVVTLLSGLFFIFVWAPHPWGREGFDHYHQLALTLAAGRPFPTMDVPWGYAYFLAAFYRVFGDHPAIPLAAQAGINALLPWLVFTCARAWVDRRTAIASAVLTGLFSFNTVYASTQSSDALCTVLVVAAIAAFIRAGTSGQWRWFVVVGALMGMVSQLRPNLILLPVLLAVWTVADRRRWRQAATMLACWALVLAPWTIRNYRLTQSFLPTSVHGGVQLWYGTLQTGPYLQSRAYNPRAKFEAPVFAYTSLEGVPIGVTGLLNGCDTERLVSASLVYWTDHDPVKRKVRGALESRLATFDVPASPNPSVLYYYLAVAADDQGTPRVHLTPPRGDASPLVYFVSRDHLGDLDIHGDLLDVFDVVRMMRHAAWNEPMAFTDRLGRAGIAPDGFEAVIQTLHRRWAGESGTTGQPLVRALTHDKREVRLDFSDGSHIAVPRAWNTRITDVEFSGPTAGAVMSTSIPLTALPNTAPASHDEHCGEVTEIAVNQAFYRREPHEMHRYVSLAIDNIERAPGSFLAATAFRAMRLFVIAGTADRQTTQQFARGRIVYALGTATSGAFALLFFAGAWLAVRRRDAVGLPLALVLYVPLTIAPMLTNMRYTVTVQPLMFVFVARAITTWLEREGPAATRQAEPDHAGTGTARRP